jgi:hypothetical protein
MRHASRGVLASLLLSCPICGAEARTIDQTCCPVACVWGWGKLGLLLRLNTLAGAVGLLQASCILPLLWNDFVMMIMGRLMILLCWIILLYCTRCWMLLKPSARQPGQLLQLQLAQQSVQQQQALQPVQQLLNMTSRLWGLGCCLEPRLHCVLACSSLLRMHNGQH